VFDPHAPYRPPAPFDRQYEGRPYYGEVAAVDAALTPLLQDLRDAARPTMVVVTGDHGEALGDHGEQTHGLFAYESTLRIPLIVAEIGGSGAPARGAGEVSAAPIRHVDILPTIADAVGVAAPSGIPGRTFLPVFERRSAAAARPSYFEAMSALLNRGWAPLTGIVEGREKYVDLPIAELYDLRDDPAERSNLAGGGRERERTLAEELRAFGAPLPGARRAESAETLERLQALGYISGDAPTKTRYTESDDPKRLVDLDQAVHRGVELYGARRFDEAEAEYRYVIARRPDMAIAYRHLAFIEFERGKAADAVALLERAIGRGVKHGGVVSQLGTYLAETGHTAEAIRLLEPAARDSAASDADTLNSLGIAYARGGRPADAREIFERVLAVDPRSSIPLENLGFLDLERQDLASARTHFERAAQADPGSSQAQAGLGVVALKQGDHAGAVEHWKLAVRLDPTNYDALYNLATTLASDRQMEAARPYLELFVRSAPPGFYAKDIQDVSRLLQSSR
jgi:Tfp pilus assembly protein PilF